LYNIITYTGIQRGWNTNELQFILIQCMCTEHKDDLFASWHGDNKSSANMNFRNSQIKTNYENPCLKHPQAT